MSEIFRFIAQRPVQRASSKEIQKRLIKAYVESQGSDERSTGSGFHQRLRTKFEDDDLVGMLAETRTFVDSDEFVGDLADVVVVEKGNESTPLLANLDSWLLNWSDRVAPKDLSDRVKLFSNKTPGQLVATLDYRS